MTSGSSTFAEFDRAGWEDAGVVHEYDAQLSGVTSQCFTQLLAASHIGEGSRVLDVAAGGGQLSSAALALGAVVTGTDMSSAQVRLASSRHPSIRFERADAQALPYEDGSFDAVVCAFGLCHVPDPVAALREFHRVLAPGGRVAFAIWEAPERAVGLGAVYRALQEYGEAVDLPPGPDFFLLSDPARSRRAVVDAGFVGPIVATAPQVWRLADAEMLLDVLAKSSVRAGGALRAKSATAAGTILSALRESLDVYRSGSELILPMPASIVSATKA